MRDILEWIYGFVGNYGIAVVIFTMLIRGVLTPLEVISRKGMRRMQAIQPKLNALQKKYPVVCPCFCSGRSCSSCSTRCVTW